MESLETASTAEAIFNTTDNLWVLISAALVFFMQAGFKVFETGMVKDEHRAGIGIKNLMDWVAGSLAFFIIGFGLMFGDSSGGLFGTNHFMGFNFNEGYTFAFFIFQLAFAGTALTIVSGAMSGRTALAPYFVASLFTAILIYPIFGHWAWGNLLLSDNKPWLADLGFMDFAGSTVVHSVGAWVGLVGIYMVGPRLGRFNAKGAAQPMKASDYAYSVLGLMILWFGWWGFNGGSALAFDTSVPLIILNTNMAAAAACLSAYIHAKVFQKNKDLIEKILGGALTGLVAITACCNVVTPTGSLIIGLLAGILHNYAYILVTDVWKLDDPVGAIPVHGFGGVFGTLCVALFGREELLAHGKWTQLGVQTIGIVACLLFTVSVAYLVFYLVKVTIGLRLSPQEESMGDVMGVVSPSVAPPLLPEQAVSQVSVRMGARAYNLFKVNEYLNLPRETRIGLVRTDSVTYLDEGGNEVPPLQAVRFLTGVIEQQRDTATSKEELLELALYENKNDLNGELQDAMIRQEQSIFSVFPDSFVFLHPKRKISSDFFWHGKIKGYNIVVLASCNSRSETSAITSSVILSQLNEIVSISKVLPPEKILEKLDDNLQATIPVITGKENDTSSCINIGVLLVDTNRRIAFYSGSGKSVHMYVKKLDEDLIEMKNIDIPLGDHRRKLFTREKIDYTRGDSFLISSEGYMNQLNDQGKRFTAIKLKNTFAENARKSMDDQQFIITRDFESWRGNEEQTEDILVIGIKP